MALMALAPPLAAQTRTATFNFRDPTTLTPSYTVSNLEGQYQTVSGRLYSYPVNDVVFTDNGVSLSAHRDVDPDYSDIFPKLTFAQRYSDNGVYDKNADENSGTRYLALPRSSNDRLDWECVLKVEAPAGEKIESLVLTGCCNPTNKNLYSVRCMRLATGFDNGVVEYDETNDVMTWTPRDSDAPTNVVLLAVEERSPTGTMNSERSIVTATVTTAPSGGVELRGAGLEFDSENAIAHMGETFTPPTFSKVTTADAVFTSSDEAVATVDATTGAVTLVAPGETVITATTQANSEFKAGTASYTLTVYPARLDAALTFSATEAEAILGHDFTPPVLTKATDAIVTYSSDNTAVATVDPATGAVSTVGIGTAVITATAPQNLVYAAGSASYTLNVTENPDGIVTPYLNVFKNTAALEGYTIIDANNDGTTWRYSNSRAQVAYSASNDKDDWLISPALALQSGKYYRVEFQMNGSDYGESAQFRMGTTPTVEGMTHVIDDVEVPNALRCFPYWVKATTTGTTYFGVHANASNENYGVTKIGQFSVSAPIEPTAPGLPTSFVVIPSETGQRTATIRFAAPTQDLDGAPLQTIDWIRVYEGTWEGGCRTQVYESTSVTPGQNFEINYSGSNGSKYFRLVAGNASGEGMELFAKAYIGINRPADVTNVVARETATPGQVELTWDAPTLDQDGNPIYAPAVTYSITDMVSLETFNSVTGTSLLINAAAPGQQIWKRYCVQAYTSTGSSPNNVYSNWVAVGTPVATPVTETFVGHGVLPLNGTSSGDDGYAKVMFERDLSGSNTPVAPDGDRYYAGFYGYNVGAPTLTTGKISLANLENPCVSLKTYYMGVLGPATANGAYGENVLQISVAPAGSDEFTTVASVQLNELADAGWHRVMAPLSQWAGQTVQIRLTGCLNTFHSEGSQSFIFADDMRIGETPAAVDMAALSMTMPEYAESGREFTISAFVENNGLNDAADVQVELLRDGDVVQTSVIPTVVAGKAARSTFVQTLGLFDGEQTDYAVRVNAIEGESNTENNTLAARTLRHHLPLHPGISNLEATAVAASGNNPSAVTLTWDTPEINSEIPDAVTEGFENAVTGATDSVDGWYFWDRDGGPVGLPMGMELPGVESGLTRMAYVVVDTQVLGTDGVHSGNKALAAFFNEDMRSTDNWLISPELNGHEQEISFWIHSLTTRYPENMNILYSTESRNPDTFQLLETVYTVPTEWTQKTVTLPEGARFFAINETADDGWIFCVDDITYIPAVAGQGIQLVGYNVYRDDICLGQISDASMVDTGVSPGLHNYTVTALYDKGESRACEWLSVDVPVETGVNDASASVLLRVKAVPSGIVIANHSGYPASVYTTDGHIAATGIEEGETMLPLAPGMYIVSAGPSTIKIILR